MKIPNVKTKLEWTEHAVREAKHDRLTPPESLDTLRARLFEVVTDDRGQVVKYGFRLRYDESWDICLMVRPGRSAWQVITCWANHRDDRHHTLDKGRYDRP